MFWHDPKRTDSGQRTAVFAVKLVDSVAVNDQFPLVATRQVEVAHQAIPRIVFIPFARVVHARPFGVGITRANSRGSPHRASDMAPLRCLSAAVLVVREGALAVPARGGSGKRRGAGAFRSGDQRMVVWNPCSGRLARRSVGSALCISTAMAGSRPRAASWCICLRFSESKIATDHLCGVPPRDWTSLSRGFAEAPNFRRGTASAVMTPSFFSSRTTSLTCFGTTTRA
jgi:hypothetical protein